LYRKTSELCEAVVAHDNSLIKLILNEIQNEIYNKSNIIKQKKMNACIIVLKSTSLFLLILERIILDRTTLKILEFSRNMMM